MRRLYPSGNFALSSLLRHVRSRLSPIYGLTCSSQISTGANLKSKTLIFEPAKAGWNARFVEHSPAFKKVMRYGEPVYECRLDIGTAGSTGLALQAILPFMLLSKLQSDIPIRLTLSGGTNVSGSPSYDYITQVLLPTLKRIGFPNIEAKLDKRGWSHGGGNIGSFTLLIPPRSNPSLTAFRLSRQSDESPDKRKTAHLRATFIAPQFCHQSFRDALLLAIKKNFGESYSVENGNLELLCEQSGHEKRMYLLLVATISYNSSSEDSSTQMCTLGRDWLYDRKIRSHERSAKEMADAVSSALAKEIDSGAAVDVHMRDQLVIFQALAHGTSEVYGGEDQDGEMMEPSLHARTAEFIAKKMVKVTFDADSKCEGVGFGVEEDKTDSEDVQVEGLERVLESSTIS